MNSKLNINRSNYELFVIDYLDNNLSQDELECLLSFLNDNPDINEEVSELKMVKLPADNDICINKDSLKKDIIVPYDGINETNYEDFFIAYYENDLTETHRDSVGLFLAQNTHLKNEFNLHDKLKLSDDHSIMYGDKESLKKKRSYIPVWNTVAAAASILVLISLWFLPSGNTNSIKTDIAYIKQLEPKTSEKLFTNIDTRAELYDHNDDFVHIIDEEYVEEPEVNRTNITIAKLSIKQETLAVYDNAEFAGIIVKTNEIYETDLTTITHTVAGDDETVKDKKPGIVSSIINNQVNKLASLFKRDEKKKRNSESPDPTYVKLIDKGILVFNTITGSETYTSKTYDNSGELTSYKVEGKEVLFSRSSREKSSP